MYELTGSLANIALSYCTGKPTLTMELDSNSETVLKMFDDLKEKRVAIGIKEYKKKRSLDANAYCWAMISKLAEKLKIPKTEIYRAAIKEIGGNSDTVCVQDKAVKQLCDGWEHNGIGWQTETFPSKIEGCTNVILYYGSSTYDRAQMHRLTEFITDECRQLGIETKSEEELSSLLNQWGGT